MKNIAVVGAGIVGICSAYFLKKSGFNVTLIDREDPGTMTSFGHACSFADYANVPVNYPGLIWDIPKMLLRKDGPLAVDFFYILKNLPWAFSFLQNCKKEKVDEIASSLTNLLKHSQLSYDEIFKDINVQEYISHEENLYLFDTKKSFEDYEYANVIRKNNKVKVRNLTKDEVKELEPNIANVYYAGQIFTGSRHTTNPLAISTKIFEKFLELGGTYIKQNVKNLIQKENFIELSLDNKKIIFDKIIISAGAWSNQIANMLGDKFPLDTERGYHILFETNEKLINRPVAWSESGFYLIQIHDGIRAAGTVEIAGLKKSPNSMVFFEKSTPTIRILLLVSFAIRKKPDLSLSTFFLVPSGDIAIMKPLYFRVTSLISLFNASGFTLLTGIPPIFFRSLWKPFLKIECLPIQ
mgnify:CR=1 FL=1